MQFYIYCEDSPDLNDKKYLHHGPWESFNFLNIIKVIEEWI
jgi:hypothetical protein